MHFDMPVIPMAIMSSAQTVQACSHALQHSIRSCIAALSRPLMLFIAIEESIICAVMLIISVIPLRKPGVGLCRLMTVASTLRNVTPHPRVVERAGALDCGDRFPTCEGAP